MSIGHNKDIDICYDDNIFLPLKKEDIDKLVFPFTGKNDFRFHMEVDVDKLASKKDIAIDFIHKYFSLVSNIPFIDFYLYRMADPYKPMAKIAIEDTACGYAERVTDGESYKGFVFKNTNLVEKMFKDLKEEVESCKLIICEERPYKEIFDFFAGKENKDKSYFYINHFSSNLDRLVKFEEIKLYLEVCYSIAKIFRE